MSDLRNEIANNILSPLEAARHLGLKIRWFQTVCHDNDIQPVKVGGRTIGFLLADIEALAVTRKAGV